MDGYRRRYRRGGGRVYGSRSLRSRRYGVASRSYRTRQTRAGRYGTGQASVGFPRSVIAREPRAYYMARNVGTAFLKNPNNSSQVFSITSGSGPFQAVYFTQAGAASGADACYDLFFGMPFAFNDVATSADFSALFDQYRLTGVRVDFTFLNNVAQVGGGLTTGTNAVGILPDVQCFADEDDNTIPNASEVAQRMDLWKARLDKPFSVFLRPKVAMAVYNGVTDGYAAMTREPWLDLAYGGIPHFALKGVIHNVWLGPQSAGNWILQLDAKYFFAFRSVR